LSRGVQPNGDIKTDLLQRDVARLSFEDGRKLLFKSARATIGATKVQQICGGMVQLFFFHCVAPQAQMSFCGNFSPVAFIPEDCTDPYVLTLQIPDIDSKDLRNILTSYMPLFQWQMSSGGFQLSATKWSDQKVGQWEIEHL